MTSPLSETIDDKLPSKWPVLRINWYESWIIKAFAIASLILVLGFGVSAFFAIKSIESIAVLAHDEEIEKTLGENLKVIIELKKMQQQLLLQNLSVKVSDEIRNVGPTVDKETILKWLDTVSPSILVEKGQLTIEQLTPLVSDQDRKEPLKWLGRDDLKVLNYKVSFPKGELFDSFEMVKTNLNKYRFLGVGIDQKIRPTLIRYNSMILIVSFLLLFFLFIIYAQRFKKSISEVLSGFSLWSEGDQTYRFGEKWKGELKLITGQFNAMADDVEKSRQRSLYLEKIASWQIIARKLAHEIKNPLTPIQMMVSQLKRRYPGDDQEFIKLLSNAQTIISEEVAGLRRMVDNFSEFARLPIPQVKPQDLIRIGQHVVDLEQAAFPDHGITFKTSLKMAMASVDMDLIRQVLINLIKNACEASGERKAQVTLSVLQNRNSYLIKIHDDGPGIPQELQERVFEAYFTTKHTGPAPGMGLGLAVCQKIVMDHCGVLSVESEKNNTIFPLSLPKVEGDY
jgi:signal transduction histidine kinase